MDHFARYLTKSRFHPNISLPPENKPGMIVVVPSYKEPALIRSLQALYECRRPERSVEVIVVINHPENADTRSKEENRKNLSEALAWTGARQDEKLSFHVIYVPDIPVKTAGVGYARKTGMDEAVYRFGLSDTSEGVIVSFDADSVCDNNYLVEIERAFFRDNRVNGASVYFEHPVEGEEYPAHIYDGIISYELHLRYLNQALYHTGFPYARHTVGSAFAVRVSTYMKQGGMNKRKAGEDFHFLHKIIPLGNFVNINRTRVIPSPRESDRVLFGTGASINQWVNDREKTLYTYPMAAFEDLKELFDLIPHFYKTSREGIEKYSLSLSPAIKSFLEQNGYLRQMEEINANSASHETFIKRFFSWFDALLAVRYLNYSSREKYGKVPVEEAAASLWSAKGLNEPGKIPARELLMYYREIERNDGVTDAG